MISSEVQRTLVKSPPELWAEISDPDSLARQLGEFGEIRITRLEPEQRVEWEAGETSGSVVIKPSGWGTKVKLTVTRELEQPVEASEDAEPHALDDAASETLEDAQIKALEDEQIAAGPDAPHEPEGSPDAPQDLATGAYRAPEQLLQELAEPAEPEPSAAQEPEFSLADELASLETVEPTEQRNAEPVPQQRRGFFARLFGRGRRETIAAIAPPAEPIAAVAPADDEALAPPARYNALSAWASQAAFEDGARAPVLQAPPDRSTPEVPIDTLDDDTSPAPEPEPTVDRPGPGPGRPRPRPRRATSRAHPMRKRTTAPKPTTPRRATCRTSCGPPKRSP